MMVLTLHFLEKKDAERPKASARMCMQVPDLLTICQSTQLPYTASHLGQGSDFSPKILTKLKKLFLCLVVN